MEQAELGGGGWESGCVQRSVKEYKPPLRPGEGSKTELTIRRASWMSFGMMVTRLAWIAQRLVSSKRPTR